MKNLQEERIENWTSPYLVMLIKKACLLKKIAVGYIGPKVAISAYVYVCKRSCRSSQLWSLLILEMSLYFENILHFH